THPIAFCREILIGETGFEPATARLPAGTFQACGLTLGAVQRRSLFSVALSFAQFAPRIAPRPGLPGSQYPRADQQSPGARDMARSGPPRRVSLSRWRTGVLAGTAPMSVTAVKSPRTSAHGKRRQPPSEPFAAQCVF